MAWEDQISLLSDEDKLKLGIQPTQVQAQLPEHGFNLSQPSTFTPSLPSEEEIRAKVWENIRNQMSGEGSNNKAIKKATEEAKPDLAQRLLQGLATFSTVAAGKQAPDYLKMNQDILEKKLAPLREKQKMQSAALDDALKMYGLSREEAQLKLAQDKQKEEQRRYAEEAPMREAELKGKLASNKNMDEELKLKELEKQMKTNQAKASDPSSTFSTVYKYQLSKTYGIDQKELEGISANEAKTITDMKQDALKAANAKSIPQKQFEQLPEDKQVVIKKMSMDNAGKINVKSQIDAVVKQLKDPKISENMKIVLGRQMLKTLNSPMGADAVGAEEAKRLGGLLQWSNPFYSADKGWFSPGPQVDEFTKQAELTSQSLGEGIASSDKLIEGYYKEAGVNRKAVPTIPQVGTAPSLSVGTVKNGYVYKGGNPNDPNSWIEIQMILTHGEKQ